MRNATASLSGAVKYAASSAEEGNITIPVNNTRQRLINIIQIYVLDYHFSIKAHNQWFMLFFQSSIKGNIKKNVIKNGKSP